LFQRQLHGPDGFLRATPVRPGQRGDVADPDRLWGCSGASRQEEGEQKVIDLHGFTSPQSVKPLPCLTLHPCCAAVYPPLSGPRTVGVRNGPPVTLWIGEIQAPRP